VAAISGNDHIATRGRRISGPTNFYSIILIPIIGAQKATAIAKLIMLAIAYPFRRGR
jgi:hypothetical protein